MKTTVVPAQITTVEDKITGNLGVSQLLLLTLPIFGGSILYVALPPFYGSAPYKIALIVSFAVICGLLSIRIKGKILMQWILTILRYNLRPRYYILNKNDAYLRDIGINAFSKEATVEATEPKKAAPLDRPRISTADLVRIEGLLTNPRITLQLKTNKKGELSVHLTEVQQENLFTATN